MTTKEAGPETASPIPGEPRDELPDRAGDVTVALTPHQLAFLALIAGLILALLRRVAGRVRGRAGAGDAQG